MKRFFAWLAALLLLLSAAAPVFAKDVLCDEGFEKAGDIVARGGTKKIGPIDLVCLQGTISVVTLEGERVLKLERKAADGNTAPYLDVCTGDRDFQKNYILSYDVMIPEACEGTWQIAVSRQVVKGSPVFQNVGSLNLKNGEITAGGGVIGTISFGEWHNFAAAFNETDHTADFYLDGRLILDRMPYSIDTSSSYPERLRLGHNASTGAAVGYVDNVKVYNAAAPADALTAEIEVVEGEAKNIPNNADIPIPTWTQRYDVNKIVVTSVGSVSIVLVAVLAVVILKRGRQAS